MCQSWRQREYLLKILNASLKLKNRISKAGCQQEEPPSKECLSYRQQSTQQKKAWQISLLHEQARLPLKGWVYMVSRWHLIPDQNNRLGRSHLRQSEP